MVYALPTGLWRVDGARSTRIGAPAQVWAVNRGRIVVERSDHSLAILDRGGSRQRAIAAPPEWTKGGAVVTAALQGSTLAVIRPWNAVDVYDAGTGARLHSWALPAKRTPFIERQASAYNGVLAYHVNGGRLWLLRLSDQQGAIGRRGQSRRGLAPRSRRPGVGRQHQARRRGATALAGASRGHSGLNATPRRCRPSPIGQVALAGGS